MTKAIIYILFFVSVAFFIYPVVFWFNNQEFTQMEVFKAFWHLYGCGFVAIFIGNKLIENEVR